MLQITHILVLKMYLIKNLNNQSEGIRLHTLSGRCQQILMALFTVINAVTPHSKTVTIFRDFLIPKIRHKTLKFPCSVVLKIYFYMEGDFMAGKTITERDPWISTFNSILCINRWQPHGAIIMIQLLLQLQIHIMIQL